VAQIKRLLLAVCLSLTGCAAPRYCNHQIIGAKPCAIPHPADAKCCLSKKPDRPVGLIAAAGGCLTTPFKAAGISGWTDYGYKAEAIGRVVQSRLSSDRFFTVDLALQSLRVDHTLLRKVSGRFIRAEIYQGQAPVPSHLRALCEPVVSIRGKLVWDGDGDGHLEIHPQHAGDYRVISKR